MTSRTSQALAFALLVTGCYPVVAVDDSGVVPDAGGPPPVATDGGDTLPCEVQAIVANRCAGCHGRPLAAPMALLTPADFNRPAPTTPDESVGWRTLARLRDPARPMPPSGMLPEPELAVLERWVLADAPSGSACAHDGGVDGGPPAPTPDASVGGDAGEGLPCDVDALLRNRCRSCHGPTPSAPMPLVSREHLLAPARSQPSVSVGALSLTRMTDAARPMPPSGVLPPEQLAVLARWVDAGMPATRCGEVVDAGFDPFAVPPRCSSGTTWALGNEGSSQMNPGRPCISCHRAENLKDGEEKAPGHLGGTVYPTGHEPDRCDGLAGVQVVLTGADGKVVRLTTNRAGNFHLWNLTTLAKPYRARLEWQGRVREMATPQTSTDCNGCHTQFGANGAPGRIVAP